ncbi:MAG: thioredoxin family protein [Pedobacter sp.]|nr:MAG: thioredoxin family protein [Pedobacter sp.]
MKRIIFFIFLAGLSFVLPTEKAFGLTTLQTDTASAVPDDLEFTTIGSEEDSTATAETDTVKKDSVSTSVPVVSAPGKVEVTKSLYETFIEGLLGGFLAFLMPCIFPMVPLTVSYFTKRAGSKQKGIQQAIIYGLSIIVIYVALGLLITLLFGSAKLNELSSSGTFNLFFFALLVVFAISFFGAFEITLPSSIVNKIDAKADNSKGLGGIFFMAASLALVSFSCTGPIIGTLLVQASAKGDILGPAVGMFGFALALALPFTLSAIFPGFLSSMPKSGGWLNSVKVCLGFLELALALKFLSSADLVWHWNWFDREVFLALWIVIFVLMGFYLLGKLKFSHDSPLAYISVPRLLFATVSFAFAVYMVPGLWGAPVSVLSGLAPPMHTQDFILGGPSASVQSTSSDLSFPDSVKYSSIIHAPKGFNAFFDLDEGLAYAKKVNKPVMLDFTGWSCVNCRKMEDNVWVDPKVGDIIRNEYVLIQLYVDERSIKMPEDKVHYSKYLKGKTTDLGKWNQDFQATRYAANSQPYYVLTDHDLNPMVNPVGAILNDNAAYISFLKSGVDKFKAAK